MLLTNATDLIQENKRAKSPDRYCLLWDAYEMKWYIEQETTGCFTAGTIYYESRADAEQDLKAYYTNAFDERPTAKPYRLNMTARYEEDNDEAKDKE